MTKLAAKATIELNRIINAAEAGEARKSKRDASLARQASKIAKLQARIQTARNCAARHVRAAIDLDESAKLKALSASAIVLIEALHGYHDQRIAGAVDKLLASVRIDEAQALRSCCRKGG